MVENSVEICGTLVAVLFAGLGIRLGQTLTRKKPATIVLGTNAPASVPFPQPDSPIIGTPSTSGANSEG